MKKWYECKVKYTELCENTGKKKKVSKPYLVDAMSFTEAEARFTEVIESMGFSESVITNIKKSNVDKILNAENLGFFFKCKVVFQDIDEAGKIQKATEYWLVAAAHIDEVAQLIKEDISPDNYELKSISDSAIVDYFDK